MPQGDPGDLPEGWARRSTGQAVEGSAKDGTPVDGWWWEQPGMDSWLLPQWQGNGCWELIELALAFSKQIIARLEH